MCHDDGACFADPVTGDRYMSERPGCARSFEVNRVTSTGKVGAGDEVVNLVPGDRDVVDGAGLVGIPVARVDADRGSVEVIVADGDVVDRVIADGKLHPGTAIAAADLVIGVQDVVNRRPDRVSDQAVVAVSTYALVDIVADDLACMRVHDVDAVEPVVEA